MWSCRDWQQSTREGERAFVSPRFDSWVLWSVGQTMGIIRFITFGIQERSSTIQPTMSNSSPTDTRPPKRHKMMVPESNSKNHGCGPVYCDNILGDAIGLVMEFIPNPRQVHAFAYSCKDLHKRLTTTMVVRCAMLSKSEGTDRRIETMCTLRSLMVSRFIHVPSPSRLLSLATVGPQGRRCECKRESCQKMARKFAIGGAGMYLSYRCRRPQGCTYNRDITTSTGEPIGLLKNAMTSWGKKNSFQKPTKADYQEFIDAFGDAFDDAFGDASKQLR